MAPGVYYILDENDNVVASFGGKVIELGNGLAVFTTDSISLGNGMAVFTTDEVSLANGAARISPSLLKLGNKDSSEIELCNGKGGVKLDGDVLIVRGTKAVGLRNVYTDRNGAYRAEAVCRADSSSPAAALQAYKENGNLSSVIVRPDGVAMNVPSGKAVTVNGREVLCANTLMACGTVTGSGKINAGKSKSISVEVSVPSGYYLAGIREIKTNHSNACKITQFYTHPSSNKVGATFSNTSGSQMDLTITIEWFALRCIGTTYAGSTSVTWADDGD